MRWREPKAVRVMCDRGAEADCDRINAIVDVVGRDERGALAHGRQRQDALDLAGIGWSVGVEAPSGSAVLDAAGNPRQVDILRDTDAEIARKTGVPQTAVKCSACTERKRVREVVESTGLRVLPGGA